MSAMFVAPRRRGLVALLLAVAISGDAAQARRKVAPAQEHLRLTTAHGDIVIALLSKEAPRTTRLVRRLASSKLYDGAVFYRAEPGFVIQGGLRDSSGATRTNPHGPVPLEAGVLRNLVNAASAWTLDSAFHCCAAN